MVFLSFVVSSPLWTDIELCKGPCSLLFLPRWGLHLFCSIRFSRTNMSYDLAKAKQVKDGKKITWPLGISRPAISKPSSAEISASMSSSGLTVLLSQPCFDHFFGPCFRGHDKAGLLAFEALQGFPSFSND